MNICGFRLIVIEHNSLVFVFTWLFLFFPKSFLTKPSICAKFERAGLVLLSFLVDKRLIFRWYKGTVIIVITFSALTLPISPLTSLIDRQIVSRDKIFLEYPVRF